MPKSRLSAFISLMLVFLSGALLGAFAHRLYTEGTVTAAKQVKPPARPTPEEVRKFAKSRSYRFRVGSLDDRQISRSYNAKDSMEITCSAVRSTA